MSTTYWLPRRRASPSDPAARAIHHVDHAFGQLPDATAPQSTALGHVDHLPVRLRLAHGLVPDLSAGDYPAPECQRRTGGTE